MPQPDIFLLLRGNAIVLKFVSGMESGSQDSSPFPAPHQQQKAQLQQCNTLKTKEIEAIQADGGARRGGGEEEQMSASKPVRFKKT